jgi:hypothetical protein
VSYKSTQLPTGQLAQAEQDLTDLNYLKSQSAWKRYALRRMKEIEETARAAVLADGLTPQERHERHLVWKALQTAMQFPESDERAVRKLVEG